MLLLRAVVLARSGYAQSESVAIEGQALRGVRYDDRSVVDAEEKPITGLGLARRELQEFQRMAGAGGRPPDALRASDRLAASARVDFPLRRGAASSEPPQFPIDFIEIERVRIKSLPGPFKHSVV